MNECHEFNVIGVVPINWEKKSNLKWRHNRHKGLYHAEAFKGLIILTIFYLVLNGSVVWLGDGG